METKRLIDPTPLIDECRECMNIEWNKSVYATWAEAEEDFMDRLLDAPTVDAVEVVRCKDCKYCETFYPEKEIGKEARQVWYCKLYKFSRKPEEFCSDGERKENER